MSILSTVKTDATVSTAAIEAATTEHDADAALLQRMDDIRDAVESDGSYEKMRGYYLDTYSKDTTLDDDGILAVIAASDDDMKPEEWAALMKAAEASETAADLVVSETVSSDVRTIAHNLGEKLAKDATFVPEMAKLMDANELAKRGDAMIYLRLNKLWTAEDWARVPVPGSKREPGKNEPFDIWTVKDHANEGKSVRYSFFTEVAATIPYYQALVTELEDVSDVLKKEPELGNERRKIMRTTWTRAKQKTHKATLTQRKSRFVGTVKKACAIKRQLEDINAKLGEGVVCQVLTDINPDKSETIMATTSPIEVSHKAKPSIVATYAVPTFLRLKVEDALAASGGNADKMFECLDATLSRDTKAKAKGTAGAAAKYPPADSVDDLENIMSEFSAFLDVDDKAKRDNFIAMAQWFKAGTAEEKAEKVKNFYKVKAAIDEVWARGVRSAFEALQRAESNAA